VAGPDCSPDCRLFSRGVGFVPSEGHGNKGVMLLGEAPGKVEAKRSEPFRGPAGLMLANLLHRLGLMRDDFLIANRTCCQPPRDWMENAPWEDSAVESCRPFFSQTLRDNPQIKVIMPLGNSALHYLLNQKGIGNFHGSINQVHWTVDSELGVADRRSYWVVPSFHPSYLMRGNWSEIQTARFDFQQAVKLATENEFTRNPPSLLLKNGDRGMRMRCLKTPRLRWQQILRPPCLPNWMRMMLRTLPASRLIASALRMRKLKR